MAQEPTITVTPEVQAILDSTYRQVYEAGRLKGFEEGVTAAQGHLMGMLSAPPSHDPGKQGHVEDRRDPATIPIEEIDLTVRGYNCLKRDNIHTLGDLIKCSEADLYDIRNLGSKNIDDIKERLGRFGYSLVSSSGGFNTP